MVPPRTRKTSTTNKEKKGAPKKKTEAPKRSKALPEEPAFDPEKRIEELVQQIEYHRKLYYIEKQPSITDREYDRLEAELRNLEQQHPLFARPDSPTENVGSDLEAGFTKFQHTIPVLSLSNTYSTQEAMEWAAKTLREENALVHVQWKVDGATLVLYYEKGRLVRAVTRGSGQTGDIVTANALTIKDIPHVLKEKRDLVVRGEVYMTFEDFQAFNETSGSIYANPRNLTAGSMKQKNPEDVAGRPLRFVAFEGHFADYQFSREQEIFHKLRELGLPVFQDAACVTLQSLETTISEFGEKREFVGFPVDGLVLKIDSLAMREELGFTAHSPRWATALKFEPEYAETIVKKIEVFVGRTGRVTPRATLEPVKLAGTTVTYATLHNADFIASMDVREGSRVKISKRGEIIPAVEEVVERGKGNAYSFPTHCPCCNSRLMRDPEAADFLCPNPECDERLINALSFFCHRKQMDIAGLGDKIIRTLFEAKYIHNIEDIYILHTHRQKMLEMEGFGEKRVTQLLESIEKSKEKGFRRLLHSLGLREIGPSVASILVSSGYDSFQKILQLAQSPDAEENLIQINGIGERTARAVIEQFKSPSLQRQIQTLIKYGLPDREQTSASDLPSIFAGETWCVTGSFQHFKPRELAMEEVVRRGGRVTGSVSKLTTHLLAGDGAGSKLEKARKLGVKIIEEREFLTLLKLD